MPQNSMTVHCRECNHQWEVICPLPMSIARFGKVVKGATAAGCPNCRAYGDRMLMCGPALPFTEWSMVLERATGPRGRKRTEPIPDDRLA